MALTKRIIPCLDVHNGRVVKGVNFVSLKDAGDPVEVAQRYDEQGADELCFLDITASSDERGLILKVIQDVAEQVFIPLTVGGGVRETADIQRLLKAGADKVSINTSAVLNPTLVQKASDFFGKQCIVVAIDAKATPDSHSGWEVFTHGGRNETGLDAIEWGLRMQEAGAGEILLTSMDADGHKDGFDNPLNSKVSTMLSISVIASGGGGTLEHFRDAIQLGKADAVLAASVFHYGTYTVSDVKQFLRTSGIPVRL